MRRLAFPWAPSRWTGTVLGLGLILAIFGCDSAQSEGLGDLSATDAFSIWPVPAAPPDVGSSEENPWESGLAGMGGVAVLAPDWSPTKLPSDSGGAVEDTPGHGDPSDDHLSNPGTPKAPAPVLARAFRLYLEGKGADKRITLWGEAGISEHPCGIDVYTNGATTARLTIDLPVEFPADGLVHFCSEAAWETECTHEMSGSLFNGDDALVLWCADVTLDALGTVGEDPGSAWQAVTAAGTVKTADQRLVACPGLLDTDPTDMTLLSERWVEWRKDEEISVALSRCPAESPSNTGEGGAPG